MSLPNACYTIYNGTTYHAHSTNALCHKLEQILKEDDVKDMQFHILNNLDDSIKGTYWYTEEDGEGVWRRFHPGYWVRISFRKPGRPQFKGEES